MSRSQELNKPGQNQMKLKKVLITGATGMVGSHVLKHLLERDDITKIISFGRRKTGIIDDLLQEIIVADFLDYSQLLDELIDIDVCFYCLGVYQSQVSLDDYFKITCRYQKALTDALDKLNSKATFVLFSAQGADTSEKSLFAFRKAKGRAENLLNQSGLNRKYIFRPGYIHPEGNRKPTGFIYLIIEPLTAALFKLIPSIGISTSDLSKAMVVSGMDLQTESRIFENNEIKNLLK